MTERIRKHDGTVEKYIGDAVMAVFGTPIAHEDDPDRAIRGCLDIKQHSPISISSGRHLRAMPHAYKCVSASIRARSRYLVVDNHRRQDFLITGDAVNVAARLQQIATPDTILVGERTSLPPAVSLISGRRSLATEGESRSA